MDTLVLYMRDDQVEIRHAPAMKSVLSSPGDPIAALSRMPACLENGLPLDGFRTPPLCQNIVCSTVL